MSNYNTNTICVQGGYEPKNGEPRVVPKYNLQLTSMSHLSKWVTYST